ncbi:Rep family protein [Staphylococcus aureus]|uniref:Rep family protein n=2 Tax=Staphylococcus aureus TaxID=1280 RepID=UPI002270F929|nr:Rep family protein [Staphylococcus aureus]
MAKVQKDDDYLKSRKRSVVIQRSYDYDTHNYDEETGERTLKPNAPTEDEWKQQIIKEYTEIGEDTEFCYFIFHDEDRLENGDKKPLHVHAVVRFQNAKMISSLIKKFGISNKQNISPVKSFAGALKYLLHITENAINDGKFIYSQRDLYMAGEDVEEDIKNKTFKHFNKKIASNKKNTDIEKEIEKAVQTQLTELRQTGKKTDIYAIYKKFGENENLVSDIFYKYRAKMNMAEKDYFADLADKKSVEGRKLTNIYISGAGGSGKSTLAKALGLAVADERGVHAAASKSEDKTYDPFGTYKYQKVSILNEMKGGLFNPREAMDIFDNHHYVPVSSRNENMNWLADYMIMTSSKSFRRFRNETFRFAKGGKEQVDEILGGQLKFKDNKEAKDEAYQFTRRFTHNIEIVKRQGQKMIRIYAFDEDKYGYCLQHQMEVSDEFYLDEEEMKNIVRRIKVCLENKDFNISNGKVKHDNDLVQNGDDIDYMHGLKNEIEFDYKAYNMKDILETYKNYSVLQALIPEHVKKFVDENYDEFERYCAKTKFGINGTLLDANDKGKVIYAPWVEVWSLEFYDYKNGNIECVGLSAEEEEQGMTLNQKIEILEAEREGEITQEVLDEEVERRNKIDKHKAFNDRIGVTSKDIDEYLKQA